MLFAVNGTLMRGLALNQNLIDVGAKFVRADRTAPLYRLWSIEDKCPAMIRVQTGGVEIEIELWEVSDVGLIQILQQEPPGLVIGRVKLSDGSEVFGVLAESYVIDGQIEITAFGGWRKYLQSQ
jgi:hypothetical protein